MSATQLERSVLEAKEREELFAIAAALGTKATTRAKKADLITQILRATGVEEAGAPEAEEKPKRTRARKAPAAAAEEADAVDVATGGIVADSAVADPGTSPASETADDTAGGQLRLSPVAETGATPATEDASERAASRSRRRSPTSRPARAAVAAPAGGPMSIEADGHTPTTPPVDSAPGPRDRQEAAPTDESASPTSSGGSPTRSLGLNGEGVGSSGPTRTRSNPNGNRSPVASSSGTPSAPSADRSDAQGAQSPSDSGHHYQQGQSNSGQSNSGQQGQGAPAGGQSRFDAEPGNRRNRRRRGRDRPERSDRDLQGQPSPESQPFNGEPLEVSGFLDLREEGYGFLRTGGFVASPNDVYVSVSQVRRFAMRKGDFLEGGSRPPGSNEKYPALLRIDTVSGLTPDEARNRPRFENLTPLFPDQKLHLELPGDPANLTARIVDLISPIGKGQRGLIVSPPKAGKTTVLKQIAHSIEANNPEVHLMVLLVDERPEEVTDMRRSVKGEVLASTFDRPSEEHTQIAELAIERAKRLVEAGRDVVIVLDGITRLARAYNLAQPATGRIMSGGIDTGALYPPKKFFGAARNVEEGGSLTILATALVETGSKMDEVIFEEFKGTGNMELRLDRRLAERRVYPAIDVAASSTRHEELLFDRTQLQQVWKLRRVLGALGSEGSHAAGLELLMDRIKVTRSNDEFLAEIAKNPAPNI